MSKLFLIRIPETAREAVHGVDYDKGLDGRECGIKHEFQTRECKPVFVTEEEAETHHKGAALVEITPFWKGANDEDVCAVVSRLPSTKEISEDVS